MNRFSLLLTAAAALAGCGDTVRNDAGVGGCTGPNPFCARGTAGGACDDTAKQATCVGDTWTCPGGQVLASQCRCYHPGPIGCVCGASGWQCDAGAPDASRDAAADVVTDAAPDGPLDAASDGAGCTGAAPGCVSGTAGGACGDAVTMATCSGGAWRCGAGMVPLSQCRCVGRPPGACSCGASGWVCDAGAPDVTSDVASDGGCAGSAPSCVAGEAGGVCGDALTVARCERGAWRCGEGEVLTTQCRCIGRPPGRDCTCGASGWACGGADAGAADAGTVDCDPRHVACDALPPTCTGGGEVPSVSGACWGPCVVYTRCAPIACNPDAPRSECPTNLVCYRTTRMCGPYL